MDPSPESATHKTPPACPWSVTRQTPVLASHTFTVWSEDPETTVDPSSEIATASIWLVCP